MTSRIYETPNPLDRSVMDGGICSALANGWLWYCDEHDDHGTASTKEEAQAHADLHVELNSITDEVDGEVDECRAIVWEVSEGVDTPATD